MRTVILHGVAILLFTACGGKDKPSIELDVGDTPTPTEVVDGGTDVCTPNCDGKNCGSDGCNDTCGSCEFQIETCSEVGVCESTKCESSKDCPGQLVCADELGECVVCVGDEDCPEEKICGADHECHSTYECTSDKDCKDYEMICNKDAGVCVECLGTVGCPDEQYCLDSYCLDDVCTAGESHCNGLDVVTCNVEGSTEEITEICTDTQYCEDGECHAQICPPGMPYCEGDLLLTCDPIGKEVIDTSDCSLDGKVCYQGECVDQDCTPGSTWCVDDSTAAICSDDGMGSLVAPCSSEYYCEEGACFPWVCEPSAVSCDGEVYQVCNGIGSTIQFEEDCAEKDQHCFNGACIDTECPPDQEFCKNDSTKATCAGDGMSSTTEACPAEHYCAEGDSVQCLPWVCQPGAAYCEDNKATVCNGKGSAVANEIDCGNNVCVGGACKPVVCDANTSSCDGNKVMQCDVTGTVLQETKTCGNDQYCQEQGGNAQCKDQVCEPGQEFCDGSKVMLCNNIGSDDSLVKDCADGQQGCKAGECVDQICTPNATYCDGNVVKKCSGDGTSSSVVETCGQGQYCGEDGNAAACANQVCTPNAKTCQGTKVMECDDVGAALEQVKDCADDGDGCVDGECIEQLCGALSFDGQNDQMEIAHSTSLNLSASVTIAVWFQSSGVANYENIIRKGTVHSSYFMWLKPPMKLEYGVYTGSAPHVANGTSTLEADKWYHFVMTYDGETVRGYLNGAPHGTAESPSGDFNTNQLPVRIGYGYPELWNNAFFSGKIDEVAIWSTALGEQAIEDALLLGIQPGQEPNLVGLWTFDNSSGQGKDLSDEGNDGIVDGATWISEGALCSEGAVCGDGQQAVWEECDDGNDLMCDGCEDCQSQGSIDLSDPLAAACTSAKTPSPSAWTVETWVRFDDLSNKTISYVVTARVTAYPVVENTKVTEAMYLYWTGSTFVLKARYEDDSDNDYFLTSQTVFQQDIWYHVAYVRTATGEQRLYINGKQEASSPSDPAPSSLAGMTCVGSTGAGTSAASSVHGLLDELRVSNIERYSGDFIPARRFTSDGNTLGLWHFDEGTGGTAQDAGPSGHDLILKDNADWAPDDCYGTSPSAAMCGDGQQAVWEGCDDGNAADGDGCSGGCTFEEMVTVPQGAFWMGCNPAVDADCEADESPYHQVTLDEYSVDLTEVTFSEYDECVQAGTCSSPQTNSGTCLVWTGSKWQPGNLPESFKGPNRPVVCVDWLQASTYCQWAGKRLCTEAEWEKAARGNDGRKFPWGNQSATCTYAVMDDGGKGCGTNVTWDVCSKLAGNSPHGLCDMAGNVWEWVADKYGADYYASSPNTNPQGPLSGTKNVIRGGSFGNVAVNVRGSVRSSGAWTPGGDGHVGVRCCK